MGTIKFTTACTEDINIKLGIYKELKKKFTDFDLSLYSETLKNIFLVFQAFPKGFKAHNVKEYKVYRRKTKTLELYLVLDYEKIMQGSDTENLQHIKEVFLKGCETFLKPMKGFEWEAFYEQLSGL